MRLPIDPLVPEILESVRAAANVVIEAPPRYVERQGKRKKVMGSISLFLLMCLGFARMDMIQAEQHGKRDGIVGRRIQEDGGAPRHSLRLRLSGDEAPWIKPGLPEEF